MLRNLELEREDITSYQKKLKDFNKTLNKSLLKKQLEKSIEEFKTEYTRQHANIDKEVLIRRFKILDEFLEYTN